MKKIIALLMTIAISASFSASVMAADETTVFMTLEQRRMLQLLHMQEKLR